MGEIAEMHIEAYQAGLDPNEMDGVDWVDFYDARSGNIGECPVCHKHFCRVCGYMSRDGYSRECCGEMTQRIPYT